jgi:hypothetical protein
MEPTLKIVALYTDKQGGYKELTQTSAYLNEKQIVPVIGDSIAVLGKDHVLLGNVVTDANNVRKVNRRFINYFAYDVAVLLDDTTY